MTVNVTYNWTLDPDTLLADTCTLTWGSVHGLYLRGEWGGRHRAPMWRGLRGWVAMTMGSPSSSAPQPPLTPQPKLPPTRMLPATEPADAFDIWLEATGLLHEAECDQDEEQGAALGWQPEAPGSNGQGDGRPEGFGRHASWRPVWLQQQGP